MKSVTIRAALISSGVIIVLTVVGWLYFSNATITQSAPCSVATTNQSGGYNAPCSNKEALYVLTEEPVAQTIRRSVRGGGQLAIVAPLSFSATEGVLPSHVCLNISADRDISNVTIVTKPLGGNQYGVYSSNELPNDTLPSTTYSWCALNLGQAVNFNVFFAAIPKNISASLIKQ